jgi:hypothetical protein
MTLIMTMRSLQQGQQHQLEDCNDAIMTRATTHCESRATTPLLQGQKNHLNNRKGAIALTMAMAQLS